MYRTKTYDKLLITIIGPPKHENEDKTYIFTYTENILLDIFTMSKCYNKYAHLKENNI